jgi:CRISPR-associated protein Cmr6
VSSRRDALIRVGLNPEREPNAGLWLDKYIKALAREDKESRSTLAREVASLDTPESYQPVYEYWKASLEGLGAKCRKAKVQNRMAVGLGSDGVLETSVTLHRTYGVPYIPGSALKGLAAAYARQYCGDDWQCDSDYYKTVFGTTNSAGYASFFDALYVPKSGHKGKALHFDIMTVHHRAYYEGRGNPPADWDDPNPVPFVSATGEYLIALAAPKDCEGWRDIAFSILERALEQEGVGAKTSSGYGRMKLEPEPIDEDKSRADAMIKVIASIPSDKLPGQLGQRVDDLLKSAIGVKHKKRVAAAIEKRTTESGTKRRKRFEEKTWFSAIQKILEE